MKRKIAVALLALLAVCGAQNVPLDKSPHTLTVVSTTCDFSGVIMACKAAAYTDMQNGTRMGLDMMCDSEEATCMRLGGDLYHPATYTFNYAENGEYPECESRLWRESAALFLGAKKLSELSCVVIHGRPYDVIYTARMTSLGAVPASDDQLLPTLPPNPKLTVSTGLCGDFSFIMGGCTVFANTMARDGTMLEIDMSCSPGPREGPAHTTCINLHQTQTYDFDIFPSGKYPPECEHSEKAYQFQQKSIAMCFVIHAPAHDGIYVGHIKREKSAAASVTPAPVTPTPSLGTVSPGTQNCPNGTIRVQTSYGSVCQ